MSATRRGTIDQTKSRLMSRVLRPGRDVNFKPTAVSLIIDYHHHYRSFFFAELTKSLDIFVAFTSPSGVDRKGLSNRIPSGLKHQIVTKYQYDKVLKSPWLAIAALCKTLRVVLKNPSPVWIIHGYSNPACYAALVAKLVFGSKLIMWAESNYHDRRRHALLEWYKRMFLRACDQAHVYGESAKEYLLRLGMPEHKIFIVQPTIDERDFGQFLQCRSASAGGRRVLYVGRFSPEKNLIKLLDSFRRHRDDTPDTRLTLTMVGFGSQEDELRDFVARNTLNDLVTIRGRVQPHEVGKVMAEHDAVILPSVTEPYGLVVLEAQWTGLPVVVSRQCGCVRDLVNETNGWIVDPTDVASMQRVWLEIDQCDSAQWAAKSRAAVATAKAFSSSRSVELTLSALQRWM